MLTTPPRGLSLLCVPTLVMCFTCSAGAQEPAPLPPVLASVPDSVLAVVKDHRATLRFADGRELSGTPVAFDAQSLTLVEDGSRRVLALPRESLVEVRLENEEPAPRSSPTSAPPPEKPRHIGLQLSQGPGNLMLDFEYGHLYGFVGTSIGYPIIFSGSFSRSSTDYEDHQYVGAIGGFGGSWKLSPTTRWRFDMTGTLTPTWWGGFSMGIGISAGFHYTAPSGFTVGFKIPVFGVAPGCSEVFGDSSYDSNGYSVGCRKVQSGADLIGNYYLQAGMSLPIVSLGYRF